MADNNTLLAHLIPMYARSTEDAATDALAYILNKSKAAATAFNNLVETAVGVVVQDCTVFRTQITEGDSRFDLVGYDRDGKKRVIGESKFGAQLLEGQGSGYLQQLADTGVAVLLFVFPDARIDHLWAEVKNDVVGEGKETELEDISAPGRNRCSVVKGTDRFLVMVSWRNLLQMMLDYTVGEPNTQADIQQLQGLAERLESAAFLPLSKEELGPEFPRRFNHFSRLYIEAIDRLREEGEVIDWIGPVTSTYNSTGRYITISRCSGWFGIYYELWARGESDDTPLWLQLYGSEETTFDFNELSGKLGLSIYDWNYFPVMLKTGLAARPRNRVGDPLGVL